MKKWLTTAAAIIMMTATITTMGTITAFAAETTQTVNKTIEVNGKGVITAKPDVASIYITVETKETTAERAQTKNAQKMEDVTKSLKALGVRDENIITQTNKGEPVVSNKKAPSGKAYIEISRRLLGENIEVTIPGTEKGLIAKIKRLFGKA